MFDNIRRDFEIYGRPLSNGGFWTLFVYRFGVWSMKRRFPPFRWLLRSIQNSLPNTSPKPLKLPA